VFIDYTGGGEDGEESCYVERGVYLAVDKSVGDGPRST